MGQIREIGKVARVLLYILRPLQFQYIWAYMLCEQFRYFVQM